MAPSVSRAHRSKGQLFGATVLALLVWGTGAACDDNDIGHCCHVLAGRTEMVPMPEKDSAGEWKNVAATSPAFDCEELTCVSYEGSKAYCTKECLFDAACPEGYTCQQVIKSMSGPNEGPKSFCVKAPVPPAEDASAFMCVE